MSSEYKVRLEPLPAMGDLAARWRELEARSRCSFFLSWHWIASWLACICDPAAARLITVRRGQRVVGMGILTTRRRMRFGPRYLYLHEVGDRQLDDLTIEYNGLLTEPGLEADCLLALVRHLRRHETWALLHLPGVEAEQVPLERLASGGLDIRTRNSSAPYVDLAALRAQGTGYLQSLSANNRSAVRRTQRKLEHALGPVALQVAEDAQQRRAYFDAMADLHQSHWARDGVQAGAFADPRILAFHRHLLAQPGAADCTELIQLSAGAQPLGYAYNFVWRGVVYFYQMGVDYAAAARHGSPGLLLLAQAVERAEAAGRTHFEFMAGDSRYKRALSNASRDMLWVSVDRVGWVSRMRRAWQGMRQMLGGRKAMGIIALPVLHDGACAAMALWSSATITL